MTTLIGIVIVFGSIIGGFLMHHGNLHVLYQPSSPLNRRVSIVVKEKKDENLFASNAAESPSGLSESEEASDRGTTEIAHRAQSSTVTTPTPAHDRY